MKHLSPQDLSALLDRPPADPRRREADRHLENCTKCREALAEMASQDRSLAAALTHDPGDAYFETFAARVEDRIRSRAASRTVPAAGSFGAWLADPRRLSWVGGVAALVAAIGLVMVAAREGGVPELRQPEVLSRSGQVAKEAAPSPRAGKQRDASSPTADDRAAGSTFRQEPAPSVGGQTQSGSVPARTPATEEKVQQAPRGPAEPSRTVQLRRDEKTGEYEPVQTQSRELAKAPESAPPATVEGRVAKPRATTLSAGKGKGETLQGETPSSSSTSALAPQDKRTTNRLVLPTPETTLGSSQLCGTVRDRGGRPVVGAQVVVADLGLTATTDREGRYCIAAPSGEHTLSVMAVGFATERRLLRVPQDSDRGDVMLSPVTVLGFGEDAGESFSTWPPAAAELARRAQRTTERALTLRSATLFDQAASEWTQALERAGSGSAEVEARARLADARYRAWEIGPNATRRTAADQALVGYLAKAPAGSAKEAAQRRLERVRR